ncbi:MAG: S41 family peptidase [Pseudomonadota bacterium]|nr:S41 family peptidase [Pseudomonadota bacterium]
MRFAALLASLAVAASALPAEAQSQTPPSPAADVATFDFRVVVAEVRRVIGERYVLPERRGALDAVLAEGLASGRYAVTDGAVLAERVNADLERVGKDRHLTFRFDPQEASVIAAGSIEKPGDNAVFERLIRRANHGITELRLMPGNVRLMTYDGFHWIGAESAAALQTAMRFLAGGDAVIIDLRGNGGGTPEAVQYIISRFLAEQTPLSTFHMNGSAEPERFLALASPPEERMIGKPLYVLTSANTGSAAEEFTGHVAGYRLGQIVGENTAGAAFRSDIVAIARQFIFSVSVGRPVLASTGKDWEAVGHAPTIKTEASAALDMAHAAALRAFIGGVPADERPSLKAVAEAMEARALRRTPDLPLAAYAGTYGERTLTTDGVRLFTKRLGRPSFPLIPLGGHRFAVESTPAMRMLFDATGKTAEAMTVEYAGGPVQPRVKRTPAR